ncbi:MAG: glycosyltransferase family 39 protein, partial [Candidatus Doudnabacteria bacterium]|nr:glycosyltransferase family 39 protein [Candidatus Doudnabacteria bacterium]
MIDLKEQKYWTPLFILLLALTARLLFYYILARHYGSASFWGPFGDSGAYMQMAKNFSAGFGFSIMPSPPYLPEAGHVPVFPFVLGLFYGHLFLFHIFQILLSASSAVLIYFIAGKFFGNRAAVLSGLFLALDPVSVFHSNMLLTETVFTFLLLLSVMFLSFLSSAKIHSRLIILSAVF